MPIVDEILDDYELKVGGLTDHGGHITTPPVRMSARAVVSNYTALSTNKTADIICSTVGAIVNSPYSVPELSWSYSSATGGITTTAATPITSLSGAVNRTYLTSFQIANNSATATEFNIVESGFGGTIIWLGYIGANMPLTSITMPKPLRTAVNKGLVAQCKTTGAKIYINAQGFTSP